MNDKLSNSKSSPYAHFIEHFVRVIFFSFALITVFVVGIIIFVLFKDSFYFFELIPFTEFFGGLKWEPFGEPKHLSVAPLIVGSLMIAVGSSIIAVPLGLGIAIYSTQYASDRVRNIIGPLIEILGGIPTIVYGYFALVTLTPLLKNIFPTINTFNALSASIAVGIVITPMIASLTTDALSQVPKNIQLAGYALGMRKIFVIIRVTIPAAISGIASAIILAFSRAMGETMIVTLAAGATPNLSFNYLEGIQTITAFIAQVSLGDTPVGSIEYYTIYALSLTLFIVTFIFNYLASLITDKFHEKSD